MNITVNVDEVTLSTTVDEIPGCDEDGDYNGMRPRTVGEIVAGQITERLVRDKSWPALREQMLEIRAEALRAALTPVIEQAMAESFQRTNSYGEPTGQQVTMRQVIAEEAKKLMTQPADTYNRDKGTLLQVMVRKEVEAALAKEIRDAVKQAREQVSTEIGQMVASAVQAGMRSR